MISNEDILKIRKLLLEEKSLNSDLALKKKLFNRYYPELEFGKYQLSDIWYSLFLVEFDIIDCDKEILDKKQSYDKKGIWGDSSVGPVG